MSESNTEKRHDRKQFDRVYKNSGKTKNNNQYHIRPKLLKEGAKKPFYHKYKTDGPMNMDRQDHVRLLKLPKKDNEKPFVHISKAVNPKKSHANFRPKLQKSKVISRFYRRGEGLEGVYARARVQPHKLHTLLPMKALSITEPPIVSSPELKAPGE